MRSVPKARLGADEALDQIALLAAIHGLSQEAFLLICLSIQTKRSPSTLLAERAAASSAQAPTVAIEHFIAFENNADPQTAANSEVSEEGLQPPSMSVPQG